MSYGHSRKRGRRLKLLAVSAAASFPAMAAAQMSHWNVGSGNWSVSTNWSPTGVPGEDDTANLTFTDGISRTITYDYTGLAVAIGGFEIFEDSATGGAMATFNMPGSNLTIGNYPNAEGEFVDGGGSFIQTGGTNTIAAPGGLSIDTDFGQPVSAGTYNLSGTGALSSTLEDVGGGSAGSFGQSGGTNTLNELIIGDGESTVIGAYSLSAGALTVSGPYTGAEIPEGEIIGNEHGTGTFIQTGGSNTIGGGSLLIGIASVTDVGFDPTGAYDLSGTGSLSVTGDLEIGAGGNGSFMQTGGTATIGGNLYVGGAPGDGSSGNLTISNSGQLNITGTVQVYGGGVLNVHGGTITMGGLSIAEGGVVDLGEGNSFIVNYRSGNDPAATIRGYLISGYNAGGAKWTGTGIASNDAASNPSAYAVGYADGGNPVDAANTGVPAGEIEVMCTVAGDANLSGGVDLSDLVIVASDFGETGADWAQGDVNYDGNVDLSDLVIVASNFGASLASVPTADFTGSFAAEWQLAVAEVHGSDVTVPEPIGISLIAAAGLALRRQRRGKFKPPPSPAGGY
jgi:hypothetical protein